MTADKKGGQAKGYLRQLCTGVLGLLAFIVGLFVAALFCSFCIVSSIAVWFRGVYGLLAAAKRTYKAAEQVRHDTSTRWRIAKWLVAVVELTRSGDVVPFVWSHRKLNVLMEDGRRRFV